MDNQGNFENRSQLVDLIQEKDEEELKIGDD